MELETPQKFRLIKDLTRGIISPPGQFGVSRALPGLKARQARHWSGALTADR